ncbi:hypothetical protein BGZ63DRAFT_216272 [Mariannaea sp. PMI_226]|nr:hypothetical protein BGZ63DRAFT_216272 [Mariannaea sp. PMI_226]
MLRQPVRSVRLPLQAINQSTQQIALNGAWRRLLTSQTRTRESSSLQKLKTAQWQSIGTQLRPHTFTTPASLQSVLRRGFRFSARRLNKETASKAEVPKKGLKEQLKLLIKVYGWVTLGVYFGLSAADFPFCFLFVRAVGTEAIGKVEHSVSTFFKGLVPESVKEAWHSVWSSIKKAEAKAIGEGDITGKMEMATWGVERAEKANTNAASLATQLALAYAIHKSFIFIRIPATAWLTPKVAKWLQARGWKIGKKAV